MAQTGVEKKAENGKTQSEDVVLGASIGGAVGDYLQDNFPNLHHIVKDTVASYAGDVNSGLGSNGASTGSSGNGYSYDYGNGYATGSGTAAGTGEGEGAMGF